ncbi:MAG: energy-coupling factor ABC transporter ATP-binding protein [Bacteroidales bacterium]|nr:energy-coupling factor ABC transporter ATP-binding protein [Bacteroidales bacterium]
MSHHYIRYTNVHYSYPSGQEALKGVDLLIKHGEKVALLGLNGAGKSTLLLLTNGLLLPTEGEVNVGDVPVSKKTAPMVRRAVGMVFQNPDDQLFMPTVWDDVAFGPRNMQLPPSEVERRVEVALRSVGAWDLRDRAPSDLSGGQKRAVAIATVLSMEPNILVMDEPSSNLDSRTREQLMAIVNDFHHTVVIATHDLEMALELCPRSVIMKDGRIIADGLTERLLRDQELLELAGLSLTPALAEYVEK